MIETGELTVPHPRLAERRFVLEPLAELAPELRHPVTRRTIREMLAGTAGQVVRKVETRDSTLKSRFLIPAQPRVGRIATNILPAKRATLDQRGFVIGI